MNIIKKLLNRKSNITKYELGKRVSPNLKADKIAQKAIREIQSTKRKWF